jgi:hypothetical protein
MVASLDGFAGWLRWMASLDGFAGWLRWMASLDGFLNFPFPKFNITNLHNLFV